MVALVAIAHAELDAEIDGDADEQHGEGDGDQVEGSDRDRGERPRRRKSDDEGRENRHDDAPGPEREEEDDRDEREGEQRRAAGALRHRRELLVGERHRSGQAHPHPALRRETELLGSGPDRRSRPEAGLQRVVVEHRLDQDEVPELLRLRLASR